MIVDTSALIAILRDEPACDREQRRLVYQPLISWKAAVIIDASRDPIASRRFD
jgi:ribonuclease VapC